MLVAFYFASLTSSWHYKTLCAKIDEPKIILIAGVVAVGGIISSLAMVSTKNPHIVTAIGCFYRLSQGINYGIYVNYQNSLNMQTLTENQFK